MKKIIKKMLTILFLGLAFLPFILYKIEALILGTEESFQGMSQLVSLFPGFLGAYFRRAFYILSLKRCSWSCYIGFGTIFSHHTAEIGEHVYIGTNCTIGDISFADYVTIGSNVDIMNRGKQHYIDNIDIPIQEQGGEYPKIYIGEDAWIGNSAVVMANIGRKSVIGAGSVIVEDTEEYSVVVGNPGRIIKKRNI